MQEEPRDSNNQTLIPKGEALVRKQEIFQDMRAAR